MKFLDYGGIRGNRVKVHDEGTGTGEGSRGVHL